VTYTPQFEPLGTTARIPRDRYGRPMIVPPWATDGVPLPYSSPSRLAQQLGAPEDPDHGGHLTSWRIRHSLAALASDARALDAAAPLAGDPDSPEWKEWVAGWEPQVRSLSTAADRGRALHAAALSAIPVDRLPLAVREETAAIRGALAAFGLHVLEAEVQCVYEREQPLHSADDPARWLLALGSLDALVATPAGGVAVLDLKTGRHAHPVQWMIQVGLYARSQRAVHQGDGVISRSPLHPALVDGPDAAGYVLWAPPGKQPRLLGFPLVDADRAIAIAHYARTLHLTTRLTEYTPATIGA